MTRVGREDVVKESFCVERRLAGTVIGEEEDVKRPRSIGGIVGLRVLEMPSHSVGESPSERLGLHALRGPLPHKSVQRVHSGKFAFGPNFDREELVRCEERSRLRSNRPPRVEHLPCTRPPKLLFAAIPRKQRRVGRQRCECAYALRRCVGQRGCGGFARVVFEQLDPLISAHGVGFLSLVSLSQRRNRRDSAGRMRAALVVKAAMIALSLAHEWLDSPKNRAKGPYSLIKEAPAKSDFPFGERGSGAILAPC